jgi:hypothetical protein
MDGARQNSEQKHEEIIRLWMANSITDGGIDRYDDLHVDQIDRAWKARKFWVSSGLKSYELAIGIRDMNRYDLSVALAFSLESGELPKGMNFHNQKQLEANFHATPPSLYLFRPGTEFWTQFENTETRTSVEDVTVEDISWSSLFEPNPKVKRCLYMEFKRRTSDEYSRSLFVTG